jgi:1-aminocyclopropane-1-carboxylate deaminase/D-cysteine desulfhydrase-like pyridoxal-dependent ACC family enzyme
VAPAPRPLHARFPSLDRSLPWLTLGELPTPVHRLDDLSARLGVELWVKRDDRSSPRYGGSKVRKLEPLLAEATRRGARTLVTVGGIGSNHVIATAVHGAHLGLGTRALVFPQPVTESVRRTLELCLALGVELVPSPSRVHVPLRLGQLARSTEGGFLVGPGGSSPLGTLGFVSAALELAAQLASGELPEPDEIFVALGSGGTAAGLALGCALAGLRSRIVAVRVVERPLANRTLLEILLRRTARLLRRLGAELPPGLSPRLEVRHDQLGGRYGRPTEAGEAAVALFAEHAGIQLETTYTGKAAAALLAHAAGPGRRRRLLFWNTHSSVDLAPLLSTPPRSSLPPEIQRWLERRTV